MERACCRENCQWIAHDRACRVGVMHRHATIRCKRTGAIQIRVGGIRSIPPTKTRVNVVLTRAKRIWRWQDAPMVRSTGSVTFATDSQSEVDWLLLVFLKRQRYHRTLMTNRAHKHVDTALRLQVRAIERTKHSSRPLRTVWCQFEFLQSGGAMHA